MCEGDSFLMFGCMEKVLFAKIDIVCLCSWIAGFSA